MPWSVSFNADTELEFVGTGSASYTNENRLGS